MAVGPPRDPRSGQPPLPSAFAPHPRSRASRSSAAGADPVGEAQAAANSRIQELNRYAGEVENETRRRIEIASAESTLQQEAEAARSDEAVEHQRHKGYEALRNLKRAQETELRQVKREGDRDLAALQGYYRDAIYGTETRGKEQLSELQTAQELHRDHSQRMGQSELEGLQASQQARVQQLVDRQESDEAKLVGESAATLEQLRDRTTEARETAAERHLKTYNDTVARQSAELAELNRAVGGKIRDIRLDSARRLGSYAGRQEDPFYQMMDAGASVEETADAYVLHARIPEHEQEHVSVSVRGDQLVLSGSRRNEEKIELGPGRMQGTSSFQSFQESFPLTFPVDSRRLQRSFDGDRLTVVLPKKTTYQAPTYKAARPERARVERPKFPENLPPLAKAEPPPPDDELPAPSPGGKGTRTLG